ncbi:MAG: hypothetical protein K9N48_03020 [Verrucomicrobia bacterium]|nr:hypothetical protein [Verrucomicrobiota bacterium]
MMKKIFLLFPLALLMAGCTTTITNLTPSQQIRNKSGQYPIEVAWESTQQSIVKDTLEAKVQVGTDEYPMRKTPLIDNRWETMVPVPADKDKLHYRVKFEYDYLSIPERKRGSALSPPYTLEIIEQ